MYEPLCGRSWLEQHKNDHTQAEIDSLGIEVLVNNKLQVRVQSGDKKARGIIKEVVRINREA